MLSNHSPESKVNGDSIHYQSQNKSSVSFVRTTCVHSRCSLWKRCWVSCSGTFTANFWSPVLAEDQSVLLSFQNFIDVFYDSSSTHNTPSIHCGNSVCGRIKSIVMFPLIKDKSKKNLIFSVCM